jgi:restriction system protein
MNPLWWLVPLVLLAMVLKSPWFKGATGESLVRFSANLRLPSATYHSFHNVTLETDRGTTQMITSSFPASVFLWSKQST